MANVHRRDRSISARMRTACCICSRQKVAQSGHCLGWSGMSAFGVQADVPDKARRRSRRAPGLLHSPCCTCRTASCRMLAHGGEARVCAPSPRLDHGYLGSRHLRTNTRRRPHGRDHRGLHCRGRNVMLQPRHLVSRQVLPHVHVGTKSTSTGMLRNVCFQGQSRGRASAAPSINVDDSTSTP